MSYQEGICSLRTEVRRQKGEYFGLCIYQNNNNNIALPSKKITGTLFWSQICFKGISHIVTVLVKFLYLQNKKVINERKHFKIILVGSSRSRVTAKQRRLCCEPQMLSGLLPFVLVEARRPLVHSKTFH